MKLGEEIIPRFARPVINIVKKKPIVAIFEVCLRCNSACRYCNLPLNQHRYEMTRQEIRTVFTRLYTDGIRFVFVQGGEPLVRRDLYEILEDLCRIGLRLMLVTNGTRVTPEFVAQVAGLPLQFAVSLDTLDRARYKLIRGADQLRETLRGIEAIEEYRRRSFIVCIVSEVNRDEVFEIGAFARRKRMIPIFGAYHPSVGKYGKKSDLLTYEQTALARVFENIAVSHLIPRGFFANYARDTAKWLAGGQLEPCDAGHYSIAIDASGNVSRCLAHPHAGNLLESDLSEILRRFDWTSIKRCSDASSCNLICARAVRKNILHPAAALLTIPQFLSKPELRQRNEDVRTEKKGEYASK